MGRERSRLEDDERGTVSSFRLDFIEVRRLMFHHFNVESVRGEGGREGGREAVATVKQPTDSAVVQRLSFRRESLSDEIGWNLPKYPRRPPTTTKERESGGFSVRDGKSGKGFTLLFFAAAAAASRGHKSKLKARAPSE